MPRPQEYEPLTGWLTTRDQSCRVQVRFASKFSLWAVLDGTIEGLAVDKLDILVNGLTVSLGPCRTLSGADRDLPVVWLIPALILHDLEALFARAEVKPLPLDLFGLPLSREYRQGISSAFIDFLSDLTYGMHVYMAQLDRLDAQCQEELPIVQLAIQSSIIDRATPRFNLALDTWNSELVRLSESLSLVERDYYGSYFRRQVWSILLRAPFLAQTNLRPQSRTVDEEAQRMVYGNGYEGTSTFGKLLHKYSVGLPSSQSARNVLAECSGLLRTHLERSFSEGGPFRILSLTSGAFLEQLGLIFAGQSFQHLELTVFGPDAPSLAEAADHIEKAETSLGAPLVVRFVEATVKSLAQVDPRAEALGEFDFIYSFGLLDSEGDVTARAVIQTLYRWLRPGGELVLANAATDTPSRLLDEYWNDSKPYDRTEQQCRDLVPALDGATTALWYDETKVEMLLQVNKLVLCGR